MRSEAALAKRKAYQKAYVKKWRAAHPMSEAQRVRKLATTLRWKHANPEKHAASIRKSRTGWSPADWERACAAQQGKCFICGLKRKLYADHDHQTLMPRRPLCLKHNSLAIDDLDELLAVVEYIKMFRGLNV